MYRSACFCVLLQMGCHRGHTTTAWMVVRILQATTLWESRACKSPSWCNCLFAMILQVRSLLLLPTKAFEVYSSVVSARFCVLLQMGFHRVRTITAWIVFRQPLCGNLV